MRVAFSALGIVLVLALSSCAGTRSVPPPEETFGHRPGDEGPGGRRTIELAPPDSATSYFTYAVWVDSVLARPASFASPLAVNGQVPVEILIKGSLPDACTELHDVKQERYGHIIQITLETRRPQGAVCARVIRPYRFYLELEGMYSPGSYTIKLNKQVFPFSVRSEDVG